MRVELSVTNEMKQMFEFKGLCGCSWFIQVFIAHLRREYARLEGIENEKDCEKIFQAIITEGEIEEFRIIIDKLREKGKKIITENKEDKELIDANDEEWGVNQYVEVENSWEI